MNARKKLIVVLVVLAISALSGWQSAHALCTGSQGMGKDGNCILEGSCYQGIIWCVRITCAAGVGCLPLTAFHGCTTAGCVNPFNRCTAC